MSNKPKAPNFGKFHAVKNSSQVDQYGYDPVSKTLSVRFKAGGEYHYSDVPAGVYEGLQKAESVGSYISKSIKGKFKFAKQ